MRFIYFLMMVYFAADFFLSIPDILSLVFWLFQMGYLIGYLVGTYDEAIRGQRFYQDSSFRKDKQSK